MWVIRSLRFCHKFEFEVRFTFQMNILGSLRTQLAAVLENSGHLQADPEQLNFLWVTEFPLFSVDEDTHQGTGKS